MKKPVIRKCVECKNKYEHKSNSLISVCESYDCRSAYAIKYYQKQKLAKEKKAKKESALEKSILKEKLKTLGDWKKELQAEINTICREIDKGWGCIATETMEGKRNSGHYISVGANDTLRFHLENIWNQSEHSNTWKSGDTIRYQQGIVKLFGQEYLDYMNNLQSIQPLKLTIEDIKERIPIARSIIKRIRLQDRKFTLEERISLRKEFNKELRIYT